MTACLIVLGVLLRCSAPGPPDPKPIAVAPVGSLSTERAGPPARAAAPLIVLAPVSQALPFPRAVQDTAPRVDRWIAEDKLRHFTMSFAVTAMMYGGARLVLDPDPALAVAAAGGIGLGIGKEVVDARIGRWFSAKDLVWDAAGVGLGILLAESIR